MNGLVRRATLPFIILAVVGIQALAQSDSLTAADTIHLTKRAGFLTTQRSYGYHFASNLSDRQLLPVLHRSGDSTVRHYLTRGQRAHYTNIGLVASGYGLMVTGLFLPLRHPETNLTLMGAGVAMFYGSFIPLGSRSRQLEQAVQAHNQLIRSREGYFTPLSVLATEQNRLSIADTLSIRAGGLKRQYEYRGLRITPANQLGRLADRLNDTDVNDGFQYTRRVKNIGQLFTSFGTAFLLPRLLVYGVQRANGRSSTLGSPILWTSLAAISIGYSIRLHGNNVQHRTVKLLNERLRSRYDPTVVGEQFYIP